MIHKEKWHRLPSDYPPAQTCYMKWLQWRRDGLMSRILEELKIDQSQPASARTATLTEATKPRR
ncbi:hypothetical protein [Paraburkholderia aspalathi]|uniref:hypothetical protein n=1 Tax=Paraburkholderia aspalathi TaxID=1324617 RepID=UPI0038BE1907